MASTNVLNSGVLEGHESSLSALFDPASDGNFLQCIILELHFEDLRDQSLFMPEGGGLPKKGQSFFISLEGGGMTSSV